MLNVTIFSKNRPLQLEALLRTYKTYFKEAHQIKAFVIYTGDNPSFLEGYDQCIKIHPEFNWIHEPEVGFKQATIQSLDPENDYSMFLVDDILFKDHWSLMDGWFFKGSNVIAHSLRLYPGIVYCYPTNEAVTPPSTGLRWDWRGMKGDWGYPMSLDGHIFYTPLMMQICTQLEYHNPNSLEGQMANLVGSGQLNQFSQMTCYPESKILNIPANRVQDTCLNRHGNIRSAEELNKMFLEGKRIDISYYQDYPNKAPHEELPLVFI